MLAKNIMQVCDRPRSKSGGREVYDSRGKYYTERRPCVAGDNMMMDEMIK